MAEKQIISGCQQYKKSSQFELVKRYSGMLMTVCRRYVKDESSAKDILQESLIIILEKIEQYDGRGSFEGWMRTITVRQSLSWLRKQAAKRESQLIELNNEQFVDPTVFEQLEKEEIIRLIQTLPEGYRTVFNMNIIEGYPHKEIAALLGITESASRSQLSRAKTLLRKKLQRINNKNYGVL